MKDIIDKLTSYNLFNYLLPGVVFALLGSKLTRFSFVQPDLVTGAFLYYFIGMVISRFGSLIVEPIAKGSKLVTFAPYSDFIAASQADPKIEVLSESNNTYRTLTSTFMLLLLLKAYEKASSMLTHVSQWQPVIILGLLMLIFLFAYRKQCAYVCKRVQTAKARQSVDQTQEKTEVTKAKVAAV